MKKLLRMLLLLAAVILLLWTGAVGASASETELSLEEARAYVKDQLMQRNPEFSFVVAIPGQAYAQSQMETLWHDLFDAAMVHTGLPCEGDYIDANTQWAEGNYDGTHENGVARIRLSYRVTYYADAQQEHQVDLAVMEILDQLDLAEKTDYEKVRAIYDFLAETVVYDTQGLEDDTDLLKYSTYGALVERSAVCQGYASAFYRLALESGVDTRVIYGSANQGEKWENHAWNIVKLTGRYFNMDVTWDATQRQNGLGYLWFLRCDENFPNHYRELSMSAPEFYASYPMSQVDYPTEGMAFGICGERITWMLLEDGTLTLSGTGAMFADEEQLWHDYRDQITRVFLEEGITAIGAEAFANHTNLREIYFPDSLEQVEERAFSGCTALTRVELTNVRTIGREAFRDCTALVDLLLPPVLAQVGRDAFLGTHVTGLFLTDLQAWNLVAFENPQANPLYGAGRLFVRDQELKDLADWPELKTIGAYSFAGFDPLESVLIPSQVTAIGEGAFLDCENLMDVTFQGAPVLGDRIFEGCCQLERLCFAGDPPRFSAHTLSGITAIAEYPHDNPAWEHIIGEQYGGNIQWLPDLLVEAAIGQQCYETLTQALAEAQSGDTVTLMADVDASGETLILRPGVTLHLGAYDLIADGFIGFNGSILDATRYSATGDYGKLIVPKENLVLSGGQAAVNGEYDVIPVWNGEDAYILANALVNDTEGEYGLKIDEENKTIRFSFVHKVGGSANNAFFKDGTGDNALKIIIRLEWASGNGVAYQDFVYNDDFVGLVSGGGYNYSFVLNNYDILNIDLSNLKVTAMILTDAGTITTGQAWTQANAIE